MISNKLLDLLRRGRSAHENHLIDGLVRGAVSRREFLRYGSVLGLAAPLLGGITGALGYGMSAAPSRAGDPGGTIRFGQIGRQRRLPRSPSPTAAASPCCRRAAKRWSFLPLI